MTIYKSEKEIFDELSTLVSSPGFIFALAELSLRHNMIFFDSHGGLESEDLMPFYSKERLIRTEFSTLFGLLLKNKVDYTIVEKVEVRRLASRAEELLEELHEALKRDGFEDFHRVIREKSKKVMSGPILREAIFYAADSAYDFQYRDMSSLRYMNDDHWIKSNLGFSIHEGVKVANYLTKIKSLRVSDFYNRLSSKDIENIPEVVLSLFAFDINIISKNLSLDIEIVRSVVRIFSSIPPSNLKFVGVSDYNEALSKPILPISDNEFIIFNCYDLYESLYSSPFYWMKDIDGQKDKASENRGEFTENFCRDKLIPIFGEQNVLKNIDIYSGKNKLGEIDVLVIYGNKAIVLQTKNKRLTIDSRKGDIFKLKEDFKNAIAQAYNQGKVCSKALIDNNNKKFVNEVGSPVDIKQIDEVYIVCVVTDPYPTLSFQCREFLEIESHHKIYPPLITDVFTIDEITEMLKTPLHFLSYLNRRVNYYGHIASENEHTILAEHLSRNLWVDDCDMMMISQEVGISLEVAMTVRRNGVPGNPIPPGILNAYNGGTLGNILKQIERRAKSNEIDLGILLLRLSGEAFEKKSLAIDVIIASTRKDSQSHDASFSLGDCGITFHCNNDRDDIAIPRLVEHIEKRKYHEKTNLWVGALIDPMMGGLRLVLTKRSSWVSDDRLKSLTAVMKEPMDLEKMINKEKRGRNNLCSCGSGKKYKRCCLP